MALVSNIDSNATGASFAEEAGIAVLPTSAQVWFPIEPNEYPEFGGQVQTVARNPINAGRQRKKGLAVDLDATGGFNSDLTQSNLERLMRGFMFADFREKADTQAFSSEATFLPDGSDDAVADPIVITNVDAAGDTYDNTADDFALAPGGFLVGDLVFASGFTNTANNGLKEVSSIAATLLGVVEALTDEAAPPAAARLVKVGFNFAAGDLDVSATGGFPTLTSTAKNFTQLGIIPGEWIYIGGDATSPNSFFSNAANNGFKRVRSVAANVITLDKSDVSMITEASTTEEVRMFFGRVIKNESDPTLIVRRSYQFQRTLGASDDSDLTDQQAEYLLGAHANELTINLERADKITVDLSFVATDSSTINEFTAGPNTLKSDIGTATKVALVEADAFNTSSDITRIELNRVVDGDESPSPLFVFLQDLSLAINNGITPNKALGVFGAFSVTAGSFIVDADATPYFSDVDAINAVRDTDDMTLDFHLVKQNGGISFDMPLITLGDGRPVVTQDEAITIPLTNAGASGIKVDATLDHTLMVIFWDYLPTAAE